MTSLLIEPAAGQSAVGQKQCFKCHTVKPITAFYKHPKMADGHLGKCKECTKRDVVANYYDRHEQKCAYDRERNQRPERKAMAGEYSKRANHDKQKARFAVSNAVRDGRLARKPCEKCGRTDRVQAHHHDYSKPLDVEWLCFVCHRVHGHGQIVSSVTKASVWGGTDSLAG